MIIMQVINFFIIILITFLTVKAIKEKDGKLDFYILGFTIISVVISCTTYLAK